MASGDTKTEALLNILGNGGDPTPYVGCGNTKTQNYILDAIGRVNGIEQEVEDLKNNPDVVDIVDTYADLQAYDTSSLTDKDIIRVLEDSTHNNKSTYYRWTASTSSWVYIGEAGGGVDVVQTTGTSTTSVMSQNATSSMVYADPAYGTKIKIGASATNSAGNGIAIGSSAKSIGSGSTVIGNSAKSDAINGIAIGSIATAGTSATQQNAIAIGYYAAATAKNAISLGGGTVSTQGVMSIGNVYPGGYNSSDYRLLTGLYDPQSDHDAATKGYVDSVAGGGTTTQLYADPLLWNDESGVAPYTKSIEIAWPLGPISANATFELINDNPVAFATYGFAILSVNTLTNMIKIISIGAPDTGVNLTVSMK